MPLSKKKNRDRMRVVRATCVQPKTKEVVQPNEPLVVSPSVQRDGKASSAVQPDIPLYNPSIHRAGDRVLIKPTYGKKLVEVVIPELDAGGNPIPGY